MDFKTMKKYQIIYADPPWKFSNKNTGGSMNSGSANQYKVMTLKQLKALPINEIADDNCVLVMWWVASMPQEAIDLVKAWGFELKTMTAFTWIKKTKLGKFFFGMGFWTRAGSENCLLAVRGKPKPASRSVRSVFEAIVGKHSEKPSIARDKIIELCGDVPRIELFARKKMNGWHSWGNDVESDIDLKVKNEVLLCTGTA